MSNLKKDNQNPMATPKVEKVIINVGIGKTRDDQKFVGAVSKNLAAISGQKPVIRKAKKAIAGFKVREGDDVGLMVTLRGNKMADFLEKLANVTLPRIRDFRGLSRKSFDGHGNITIGVKESVYFPEISHESENIHSLEIAIVTTSKDNKASEKLLEKLGFPFEKKVEEKKNG